MDFSNRYVMIFIAVVLVCGMQIYSLIQYHKTAKPAKEEFLSNNPDAEFINDSKAIVAVFAAFAILLIVVGCYTVYRGTDKWESISYFAAVVFAVVSAYFPYMKRICYLGKNEFYADGGIHPYSKITESEQNKGFLSSGWIVKCGKEEVQVTKNIADRLMEHKQTKKRMTGKYTKN